MFFIYQSSMIKILGQMSSFSDILKSSLDVFHTWKLLKLSFIWISEIYLKILSVNFLQCFLQFPTFQSTDVILELSPTKIGGHVKVIQNVCNNVVACPHTTLLDPIRISAQNSQLNLCVHNFSRLCIKKNILRRLYVFLFFFLILFA